ncbi:MAG: hypothetical protein QM597_05860 [Aeromicrobium sp.]|uniref:hypothetical protein n=1 Tax=Aeromicrobium sp. TaxID=1871063 RepID=UPI0039E31263
MRRLIFGTKRDRQDDLPSINERRSDNGEIAAAADLSVLETAIRALTFPWSPTDQEAFCSPPYPVPAALRPLIARLEDALPADHEAARQRLLSNAQLSPGTYVPSSAYLGIYVPLSAGGGHRIMASRGLPAVVLLLLSHGILTTADGERLVKAVETTGAANTDHDLVVRHLLLRILEAHLTAGDAVAAEKVAAIIASRDGHVGWREVARYHAAHGDAAAFFRNWKHYAARLDTAQMRRLKAQLVAGVAIRAGWREAAGVCGDRRIGDGFLRHAFEPPAHGYDDLLALFGGDAAGTLPEADELHCLVAAAVAESRPRPTADHRGVEKLLARISALDPNESREAMRTRDHLLSTLHMAIGSEETLARLRKQVRTPRLRRDLMRLYSGPPTADHRP